MLNYFHEACCYPLFMTDVFSLAHLPITQFSPPMRLNCKKHELFFSSHIMENIMLYRLATTCVLQHGSLNLLNYTTWSIAFDICWRWVLLCSKKISYFLLTKQSADLRCSTATIPQFCRCSSIKWSFLQWFGYKSPLSFNGTFSLWHLQFH